MVRKKGQSILEYLLLLTAVLFAILAAVGVRNGPVRVGLGHFFNNMGTVIACTVQ